MEENKPENQEAKQEEKVKEIHHYHYRERERIFRPGKFFIGLFIIIVGLMLLAQNMGWLEVNFSFRWNLIWPAIIILIGLSMLNFRGWLGAVFGILITLIVLILALVIIFGPFNYVNQPGVQKQEMAISKDPQAQIAQLEIKAGAGELKIKGGASELIKGNLESFLALEKTESMEGTIQKVSVKTIKKEWSIWRGAKTNKLDLVLNSEMPFRFDLDTGAAKMDLDLREIMAEEIDLDTGASALDLKLGDKIQEARIKINAGASSIDIEMPKTVGVRINLDSGLTSKNLPDFRQIDSKHFESDNYNQTDKKIEMDLNLGVSSLNIKWR